MANYQLQTTFFATPKGDFENDWHFAVTNMHADWRQTQAKGHLLGAAICRGR